MRIPIHAAVASAALMLSAPAFCAEEEKPAVAPAKDVENIPKSPAEEKEREGIETWTWTGEGPAQVMQVSVVKPKEQGENRVLKLDFLGTRNDKVIAKCLTNLVLAEEGKLACQFYSAEKSPPKIAFALCTGDKYVWQECEPVELKEGWTEVKVDLGGKKWKSAASAWKHEVELQDRCDVRAVHLLVYNGRNGGVLYLDALKLDRDEKFAKHMKDLIKSLGDENFDARESAEKELIKANRHALEYLSDAAEHAEPEIAQRAKRIIDSIEHPKVAEKLAEKANADEGAPKMKVEENVLPKKPDEAETKGAAMAPEAKPAKKSKKEREKEKELEKEKAKTKDQE